MTAATVRGAVVPALVVLAYVLTRTLAWDAMPPFVDEGLHIAWARQTLSGELTAGAWQGKWLSIKLMALVLALPLPLEPLQAGRLAAVVAGTGTLVLLMWLGRVLFSVRTAIGAGVIYTIVPLAFFHERMALTDVFQSLFTTWSMLFAVFAVRSPSVMRVAWLGLALSTAVLAKLTAVSAIVLPLAAVGALAVGERAHALRRVWPALVAPVSLVLAMLVTGFANAATSQTVDGVSSLGAMVARGSSNVVLAATWYSSLLTPFGLGLSVLALLWLGCVRGNPETRYVALAAVIPVGALVGLSSVWFSRYLVFSAVPLSLLIAELMTRAATQLTRPEVVGRVAATMTLSVGGLFALSAMALDWRVVTAPLVAEIPVEDRRQYLTDWSAGYGVESAAAYLRGRADASPAGIHVIRYHYWDQPLVGLDLFLAPSARVSLRTLNAALEPGHSSGIAQLVRERPTYLVLNLANAGNPQPLLWDVLPGLDGERVWTEPRPTTDTGLSVWRVTSREGQ